MASQPGTGLSGPVFASGVTVGLSPLQAAEAPARRHANNRVARTSHQTRPGSTGGSLPAVIAPTHARDEPGNRRAKTSGYRATSSRLRRVARMTQHEATR